MDKKAIYRAMLNRSVSLIGVERTKKVDALLRFHRVIHLKNPKTLADKLCWLELNIPDDRKSLCTDKYEVRKWIAERGYSDILVPLVGNVITTINDLHYDSLPDQFVLKATHGCGMNLIVQDKGKVQKEYVYSKVAEWLNNDYPRACLEPHYQSIPHRVIAEKLIAESDRIIDYKIHCIHGKAEFILVCGNRQKAVQKRLYTTSWEPINEMIGPEAGKKEFARPEHLEKMIEISESLASEFDFVRVDLYDVDGRIWFGELTFSPASGVLPNFSNRFIIEMGKKLNLPGK